MTIENDFLPFAVGGGANVLSQAAYAALSAVSTGYQSGVAQSAALNKTWRQSSIMAAVLAQFIVAQTGQPAIDDGTTATLLANFTQAVVAASKQRVILTDTGAVNAYAAANAVPLTSLPTTSGVVQTVQIAHTNTGTSTYAPDGLAAKPIFGLGGSALQGNELPANGIATLVSFVSPLLNGGNLCWVLFECVGGAQQVAPATQSQHAVQAARVGTAGGLSFRNIVQNGAFNINQRGYVSGTATTSANQFTLDRWKVQTSGQSLTFAASGAGNAVTAPAGGLAQVIEGANIAGGTYVASWVGSGTLTVGGGAIANGGTFTLGAGGNVTIVITGAVSQLQIELGTVPTSFEFRPYSIELALCQRYCFVVLGTSSNAIFGWGIMSTATICGAILAFLPVPLRATPTIANIGTGTITIFSTTQSVAGVPNGIYLSGNQLSFNASSASSNTVGAMGGYALGSNVILVISADI